MDKALADDDLGILPPDKQAEMIHLLLHPRLPLPGSGDSAAAVASAAQEQGQAPSAAQEQGQAPPAAQEQGQAPPAAQEQGQAPPAAQEQGQAPSAAQEQGQAPPAAQEQGQAPSAAQEQGQQQQEQPQPQQEQPQEQPQEQQEQQEQGLALQQQEEELQQQSMAEQSVPLQADVYTCHMDLKWGAQSKAAYSGKFFTTSVGMELPFGGTENPVKLTGRSVAEFKRSDGCIRTAYQWYQTGRLVYPSMDTEVLYTAAKPVWTNPLMKAVLSDGVKFVKPASGGGWELSDWSSSQSRFGYKFTYTVKGVKGSFTSVKASIPMTSTTTTITGTATIESGSATVAYAGTWGGRPDVGSMFIPLAGTKGSVTGCTLVATTEYPKPKPNLGGADLPLVPVVPKRKLVLDCSAMTVQLDKVHFTYEDSQQAGVFYSAYIQLTLTGVGKAVKAESLFNDAHPAA